jgi:hypothetical protein
MWTYVSVLPRPEVLLRPLNAAQTPTELVNALLQAARLLRQRRRFRRRHGPRFTLDHDVEVDELLAEGGHVVREAERVLADEVGGEDEVALALAFAFDDDHVRGVGDDPVDVEGTTGLNLRVKVGKRVSENRRLFPSFRLASSFIASIASPFAGCSAFSCR